MQYQVKCNDCGLVYEDEHKMSEDHKPCPECGGEGGTYIPMGADLKFEFKGSGWAAKEIKDLNRAQKAL